MNLWMADPFKYPEKPFDRGKVLSAEDLNRLNGQWGRYRDVDDDGIPWRTVPGTEHVSASYFARGSGHDENANYSELPEVWERVMDRLKKKYNTARQLMPLPLSHSSGNKVGILAYGTSHHAVVEALDRMAARGLKSDYMRIRGVPFHDDIFKFIRQHDTVYVVDQNRDGQMFDLLRLELKPEHDNLISIRHYDGTPIPAVAVMERMLIDAGLATPQEFQHPGAFVTALAVEGANA
jgi:2-oxoglutarate ferredoxin oxidoreductase subunit alpha